MQNTGPKIKLIVSLVILLMLAFCSLLAAADSAQQIKTDKDSYNTGETIRVNFSGAPGSNRDWICIVAAGSADDDAGDYKHMPKNISQGELTFDARPPGKYEVRAYYNYSRKGYIVSARYSFTVVDTASAAKPAASEEKITPVEISAAKVLPASTPQFNVAVFHFTPLSMDAASYGRTVTNALINAPKMRSSFTLLGRKDLEDFLSANNLQQDDQIDNIIEIGTRLDLNFVIGGTIEKRGTLIITNCKVVNIAQKSIVYSNKFISTGEANLIGNVMNMSTSIIEAVLRSNN